jgi:hypothetical protein
MKTEKISFQSGLNNELIIAAMRRDCDHKFAEKKTGYFAKNQCIKCGLRKRRMSHE